MGGVNEIEIDALGGGHTAEGTEDRRASGLDIPPVSKGAGDHSPQSTNSSPRVDSGGAERPFLLSRVSSLVHGPSGVVATPELKDGYYLQPDTAQNNTYGMFRREGWGAPAICQLNPSGS